MSIFLEREIDRISQDVLLLKRYLIKSKDLRERGEKFVSTGVDFTNIPL